VRAINNHNSLLLSIGAEMTVFAAEWPGFEARLAVEQNPA
jgi:hypothetical protein